MTPLSHAPASVRAQVAPARVTQAVIVLWLSVTTSYTAGGVLQDISLVGHTPPTLLTSYSLARQTMEYFTPLMCVGGGGLHSHNYSK